jgi:hypothetical protein
MIELSQNTEWKPGAIPNDPISHGSIAESFMISQIDALQIAALWASVPHWSSNCYIPRGGLVYVNVISPPFTTLLNPYCVAAGEGTVTFGYGSAGEYSIVNIELDAGSQGISASILKSASEPFAVPGSSGGYIIEGGHQIRIEASANVTVFSLGFQHLRLSPAL